LKAKILSIAALKPGLRCPTLKRNIAIYSFQTNYRDSTEIYNKSAKDRITQHPGNAITKKLTSLHKYMLSKNMMTKPQQLTNYNII
jgi:hypothetical protein